MIRRKMPWLPSFLAFMLLAAALPSVSATQTAAAPPRQLQPGAIKRDVTYCTAGGVDLKMDIYAPRTADNRPAPAVVYAHGGAWTSGDKALATPWVSALASQGYFAASINYRLAPQYKWP